MDSVSLSFGGLPLFSVFRGTRGRLGRFIDICRTFRYTSLGRFLRGEACSAVLCGFLRHRRVVISRDCLCRVHGLQWSRLRRIDFGCFTFLLDPFLHRFDCCMRCLLVIQKHA